MNKRLMLGASQDKPDLLVEVTKSIDENTFSFLVVNGLWHGEYTNGFITVWYGDGTGVTHIDTHLKVLCDNQERLDGNYQDVFENFHDASYRYKRAEKVTQEFFDDDIPF